MFKKSFRISLLCAPLFSAITIIVLFLSGFLIGCFRYLLFFRSLEGLLYNLEKYYWNPSTSVCVPEMDTIVYPDLIIITLLIIFLIGLSLNWNYLRQSLREMTRKEFLYAALLLIFWIMIISFVFVKFFILPFNR